MNLHWMNLTQSQKQALAVLCEGGPCQLAPELGEQLTNLGLVERGYGQVYSITLLGATLPPAVLH